MEELNTHEVLVSKRDSGADAKKLNLEKETKVWKLSTVIYGQELFRDFKIQHKDLTISVAAPMEFLQFAGANFHRLHKMDPSDQRFHSDKASDNKLRFYSHCSDLLKVTDLSGQIVGVFCGNPLDWSSYYIRYCSILESQQGKGLYPRMVSEVIKILQLIGLSRVEVDISTANAHQIYIHNKMEFKIISMMNSDRWGQLIRFAKFLNKDCEKTFLTQFCADVRPQSSTKENQPIERNLP